MQNTFYIDVPIYVGTVWNIMDIICIHSHVQCMYHLPSCFSIFLTIFHPLHPILLSLFPRLRQRRYVSAGFSESDLAIDC